MARQKSGSKKKRTTFLSRLGGLFQRKPKAAPAAKKSAAAARLIRRPACRWTVSWISPACWSLSSAS